MTNKLTYRDRFAEVLSHLTHGKCPDWLIDEWLDGENDNLQSWVVDHQVFDDWAMGITIIEACQILAQEPQEGRQQDMDYSRPKYYDLVEENNHLKCMVEHYERATEELNNDA